MDSDRRVSGLLFTVERLDSGLSCSLQNSGSERRERRWREKRLVEMSAEEIDRFFAELILLVGYKGRSH